MLEDSFLPKNNQAFSQSSIHSIQSIQKSKQEEFKKSIEELKMINKKLFDDNRALLKECIRLRRSSSHYSSFDGQRSAIEKGKEL